MVWLLIRSTPFLGGSPPTTAKTDPARGFDQGPDRRRPTTGAEVGSSLGYVLNAVKTTRATPVSVPIVMGTRALRLPALLARRP